MSTMVRTQISLPRDVHDRLRSRGEREGLSMAEQVRLALALYLAGVASEDTLRADDPLWALVGAGEGPADAAENHDHYLYGGGRRAS